ncbi:MAG TPA: GAF domain-containing protein [Aggregatilineales bacterium]|nr:GAF domain-containing protein [Anaerolineae bacterium]HUN07947.1 GAF domain-containing protein [Aggregatilineales bacterium]
MNTRLSAWFRSSGQQDPLFRLRKRYVQAISILMAVAAGIGMVAQLFSGSPSIATPFTLIFMGVSVALFVLAQREQVRLASFLLVGLLVVATLLVEYPYLLIATLAVISAAALVNGTAYGITNALVFGKGTAELLKQWGSFDGPAPLTFGYFILAFISLAVVTIATRYFVEQAEELAASSDQDARLIRAVAETGQAITQERDRQALLPRAAELIRDRLALSHVQIYLVSDDRTRLTRVATTDHAIVSSGTSYALREQPALAQVVTRGEPLLVHMGDDPAYSKLLALDAMTGLLLPIIDNDLVLGVLDLQSRRVNAFPGDAARTLGIMASLLGTAMQNAIAFEEQERRQNEIRKLFLEAETNLRENQRLNEQLSREGWNQYLNNRSESAGVTLAGDQIRPDSSWSPTLAKASLNRQIVTEQRGNQQVIAVPVTLGGDVIGAIEIESNQDQASPEALETVKAIAQRLATSVDKARLFEETRATAAQEQRLNEISARYQNVNSVDDLLRITLLELSETLGATQGAIRLGQPTLASEGGEVS